MARAGQQLIERCSPERFAEGLMQAAEVALATAPPRPDPFDRALLRMLSRR
jgi:hypothetical protein